MLYQLKLAPIFGPHIIYQCTAANSIPPMLKNASASWLRFPSGIVYGKVDFNASAALDVDEACDADELEVEDTTDDDVVDDVVDG